MTDGLTWRVAGARREVEGARLPARALHYPTLTVVSRAAGANMRHMQMEGAAGRTRGRRCKGVWKQCSGGNSTVYTVQIMQSHNAELVKSSQVMTATRGEIQKVPFSSFFIYSR